MKKFKLNRQSGSVFTVLLAGVAMAGALSIVVYQIMSGPMASMVRVGNKTVAKTQLHSVSNIMIMAALNQPASGDCDGDGAIEPSKWRETTGDKPDGGGLIPIDVGAPLNDPWSSEYGYCVWDTGSYNDPTTDRGCDTDLRRLKGSPDTTAGDAETQYVVAIVSAGPNRLFETKCNAYTNISTPLIEETGDDVIQKFTYAEASSATSSIWKLKTDDPDVAEIAKNIDVGAPVAGMPADIASETSGIIRSIAIVTDGLIQAGGAIRLANDTDVTSCAVGNAGDMRYNAGTGNIEVCDGSAWKESSGGVSGLTYTAVPFVDSSGTLIDDITNLAWDATNDALKVNVLNISKKANFVSVIGNAPIGVTPAALSLNSLNDVVVTTPVLDQVLIYDGTDWINQAGSNVNGINDLTDAKVDGSSLFLGSGAGAVSTGPNNTVVGVNAMANNTTGDYNVVLGSQSMPVNTSGRYNVAIGYNTLNSNINGDTNISLGYTAMYNNNTGDNNIAIGQGAMHGNRRGANNIVIGSGAFSDNYAKAENIVIGFSAMARATPDTTLASTYNVAIGSYALYGSGTSADNTGTKNTAIGNRTLRGNSTGSQNVALGSEALTANSTGENNTALGSSALVANTSGYANVASGFDSMKSNTTGNRNVAIGTQSLFTNTTGIYNTTVGWQSMYYNTGNSNTAMGIQALHLNEAGGENTALGVNALRANTTGSYNTAVGYGAGPTATGLSNTTAVGTGAIPTASNTMKFGNDNVTDNYFRGNVIATSPAGEGTTFGLYKGVGALPGYAAFEHPTLKTDYSYVYFSMSGVYSAHMSSAGTLTPQSDRRLKEDIKTTDLGLEFINKLRPVSFKWKKTKNLDYGFIAQDVNEALDGLAVEFLQVGNEGETMNKPEDQWMLAKTGLISPMVKSIQQLDDKVEALSTEVSSRAQSRDLVDSSASLGMTRERVLEYLLTALAALFALFMISTEIRIRRLKAQGKNNL